MMPPQKKKIKINKKCAGTSLTASLARDAAAAGLAVCNGRGNAEAECRGFASGLVHGHQYVCAIQADPMPARLVLKPTRRNKKAAHNINAYLCMNRRYYSRPGAQNGAPAFGAPPPLLPLGSWTVDSAEQQQQQQQQFQHGEHLAAGSAGAGTGPAAAAVVIPAAVYFTVGVERQPPQVEHEQRCQF